MADDANKRKDPDRIRDQLTRVTVPPELDDADNRKKWGLEGKDGRGPYLIELNVQHVGGLPGAAAEFLKLYERVLTRKSAPAVKVPSRKRTTPAGQIGKAYYRCYFTVNEWRRLIAADELQARQPLGAGTDTGSLPLPQHLQIVAGLPGSESD